MEQLPQFLFVGCQRGAEGALKAELARRHPELRLAFSRPGFLTLKRPDEWSGGTDFQLQSVFARCHGFCLGRVEGSRSEELAEAFWARVGDLAFGRLHVWQRDAALPGEGGFEPGVSGLAYEIGQLLVRSRPRLGEGPRAATLRAANLRARPGQQVLDCIVVEPDQWWIGWHLARSVPSCWPGGVPLPAGKESPISRAYYKMHEALAWSRLPLAAGQRCVEIGSAPGGACEALLEQGLEVIGIDPAEMDPRLLAHPNFRHIRARAADLKRREFQNVQWLMADSNVAPQHTLDTVEAIVTHRRVHIRGLLLTLKLPEWRLADQLDAYLERVRSWGYRYVRARQLAFNRQEVCVLALRRPSIRRVRVLKVTHQLPGPPESPLAGHLGQPSP